MFQKKSLPLRLLQQHTPKDNVRMEEKWNLPCISKKCQGQAFAAWTKKTNAIGSNFFQIVQCLLFSKKAHKIKYHQILIIICILFVFWFFEKFLECSFCNVINVARYHLRGFSIDSINQPGLKFQVCEILPILWKCQQFWLVNNTNANYTNCLLDRQVLEEWYFLLGARCCSHQFSQSIVTFTVSDFSVAILIIPNKCFGLKFKINNLGTFSYPTTHTLMTKTKEKWKNNAKKVTIYANLCNVSKLQCFDCLKVN